MKIVSNQGTVIVTAPEQAKEQLPQNVETVQIDVANLVFDNMMKEMKISQLESDLGMALLEIMQMKMGVI